MGISLVETSDADYIKYLCALPGIWQRMSEGVSFSEFVPSVSDGNVWLSVLSNDKPIGLILLQTDSSCSVIIHPYLSIKNRGHGIAMMMKFYEYFCDNFPGNFNKINCLIPTCFPNVIKFAKKVGFMQEGCSRESYYMDNKYHDRIMLGITRKEANNERCS